jgi:predicted flap endonuclease-1-like 5' DNA nuclease
MNTCIIIPIIVGLISALLGYLLGKLASSKLQSEVDSLTNRNNSLAEDLKKCNIDLGKLEISNSRMASASKSGNLLTFNALAAKDIFGKNIKENDLTIIEGIGPKIQELFQNMGIKTWEELSNASVEKCQEVLNSGGDAFKIHTPKTWPEQAKYAVEGRWKALLDWQEKLDGGK